MLHADPVQKFFVQSFYPEFFVCLDSSRTENNTRVESAVPMRQVGTVDVTYSLSLSISARICLCGCVGVKAFAQGTSAACGT